MASPTRVTWDLSATSSPFHAGGDGLQHQARRGSPGRNAGRLQDNSVQDARKTGKRAQDFMLKIDR